MRLSEDGEIVVSNDNEDSGLEAEDRISSRPMILGVVGTDCSPDRTSGRSGNTGAPV